MSRGEGDGRRELKGIVIVVWMEESRVQWSRGMGRDGCETSGQ